MNRFLSGSAKAALVLSLSMLTFIGAARVTYAAESSVTSQVKEAAKVLAPTGKLRVGLYPGSPNSLLKGVNGASDVGMGFELGAALAKYLNVPFDPIIFAKNGDVLAAAKEGKIDFVFVNATPAREQYLSFAAPILLSEQSYLVGPKCEVRSIKEIDRPFMKIGVAGGSTSEAVLPGLLKNAKLISTKNMKEAEQMLLSGELDAFATNKGILYDLAGKVPGAVVLDETWGQEQIAIGVPKGRESAMPVLENFTKDMRSGNFVPEAMQRAGMRGVKLNRP
jgi:polar amino acid transport system substrate-binding protein